MPRTPLRFVHAAGLFLDVPLRGTGELSGDLRSVAEEATVAALHNVIAACLDHEADFLLLAGDTFDEARHSLRARVALRQGLEQLAQHEIPVFVLPGQADGGTAWDAIPDLPENVTVLRPGEEPALLTCDDQPLAEIVAVLSHDVLKDAETDDDVDAPPFRVALLPPDETAALVAACVSPHRDGAPHALIAAVVEGTTAAVPEPAGGRFDYLALGGPVRKTVTTPAGLLHGPGAAQGLTHRQTGPHGITLVEVAEDGTIVRTRIDTAPVRWEQFVVYINERTIREELLEEMQFVLDRALPEPSERLWLITWAIHGSGPLFESLADETTRHALVAELEWNAAAAHDLGVQHSLRLCRDAIGSDEELRDNRLATEFAQRLESTPLSSTLPTAELDPAVGDRLSALLPNFDPAAILGHARQFGRSWFVHDEVRG